VAAALVALHPLLVAFSATAFVEMTYLAFLLPGILFCLRALRWGNKADFVVAGLFLGLGYLVRTEPLLYVLMLGGMLLAIRFAARQFQVLPDLRRFALTVAVFAVLALPYAIWLSVTSGGLHLEGKSQPNYNTDSRVLSGMSIYQASFEVDDSLQELGSWYGSQVRAAMAAKVPFGEKLRHIVKKLPDSLRTSIGTLTKQASLGAPMLFALAFFGLFGAAWRKPLLHEQVFLLAGICASVVALGMIFYFAVRFYVVPLFIMTIWASRGLVGVSQWTRATVWGERQPPALMGVLLPGAIATALALFVLGTAWRGTRDEFEIQQYYNISNREVAQAAQWIREHAPPPTGKPRVSVADTLTLLPFVARAEHIPLPYSSGATALRYLDQRGVDYIVVSERTANDVPYGKDWAESGIPDNRAHLVHTIDTPTLGKLSIYEWKHTQ
jgi:hypothetical protein